MKHTLVFIRQEFHGISSLAVCNFESNTPNGKTDLEEAVTTWISETTEGAENYAESYEDFNIGDLAGAQSPELLASYGVRELSIEVLEVLESCETFDHHLYQPKP